MTKPGFVLTRAEMIFNSSDKSLQRMVAAGYCQKRNKQPKEEKSCYCGHTIKCSCGNPTLEDFKEALFNGRIKEKDLL